MTFLYLLTIDICIKH